MEKYHGALIRYNDTPRMGGEAKFCFISIRPKYKSDVGLHVHEYWHVLQWYFWLTVFAILGVVAFFTVGDVALALTIASIGLIAQPVMYLIPAYAKLCEIICYRKQIACYPNGSSKEFAIQALMNKYKFRMTREEAEKALK